MLVLSRKTNESLKFNVAGKEVKVCILDIRNKSVRIGIDADKDIRILRDELTEEKEKELDIAQSNMLG